MLTQIADQLHALGYRGLGVQSLKPKHAEALVQHWQSEHISTGTIKNRLATIRWWAGKVNRKNVVARSNSHYGIPERVYMSTASKAKTVNGTDLERVRDEHVRMSLELQQALGLRREEAIKFNPGYADQGDQLTLKPTWTKGGKARLFRFEPPNNERSSTGRIGSLAVGLSSRATELTSSSFVSTNATRRMPGSRSFMDYAMRMRSGVTKS